MTESVEEKYRYSDLTWPEMNQAIAMQKVILLPVGTTEQHGPHLPLDTDCFLVESLCLEAGRRNPKDILVMPTIPYGYNLHHIDFPGTIHIPYDHFIEYCLDVVKSVAYHGFKKIIIVDGHGSNEHLLEFVARRAILETDSLCASFLWVNLVKEKFQEIRESSFPGGAAHACELETSTYLHLAPSKVQMDKAVNEIGVPKSKFHWVDLISSGPVSIVEWTSSLTKSGVTGEALKATPEKGKTIFEEAVKKLLELVAEFKARPIQPRIEHHQNPTGKVEL